MKTMIIFTFSLINIVIYLKEKGEIDGRKN